MRKLGVLCAFLALICAALFGLLMLICAASIDAGAQEKPNQHEQSLRAAIVSLKLDWVDPDIEKHFTLEPVRKERKVFHFDSTVSSKEAEERMKAEGWDPANLAELLDYAKNEWNGKDWVVALGSSAQVGGDCGVPGLYRGDAERDLRLSWGSSHWYRRYRFLAARN